MLKVTLYTNHGTHFGYYLGPPKDYNPEKENVVEFDCLSSQDRVEGYQIIDEWWNVLYRSKFVPGEFTFKKCARIGSCLAPLSGAKITVVVPPNLGVKK